MTEARQLLEMAGRRTFQDDSYAGACMAKWKEMLEPMWPGDPIRNPYNKRVTAVLLENEMSHLRVMMEDTLSTNAGAYTKHVFPTLRRVFPNLIANQLVSVQPMTSSVGGVFYFERKYGDRKGTKVPQFGIADQPYNMGYDGELNAGDNMLANFGQYYSSEFVDYDVCCTDTGAASATLNQGAANCRVPSWKPIRANGTSGQRTFYVKAYYRIVAGGGTNVVATMNDAGNLIDQYSQNIGTFNVSTGAWAITPKDSGGAASNFAANTVVYFQYFVNWELVGQTSGAVVPSVNLDITLQEIRAESHKMKAKWSVEAMDDMRTLHGLDAETELVSTFASDIMLEIDRQIIQDLITSAKFRATYAYSATIPGEIESIRRLITMLGAVAGEIHRATLRRPANFIVVSTAVGSLLDQLSSHGDYASIEQNVQDPTYGPQTSDYGIARVGTLLKRFAVYQNPFQDQNTILIGLKGNNYYDAGYVYAPYIPLEITPTFLDPDDFMWRRGARCRHATKMLRPEYYGVITCSGLPTVTTI